jgi:HPt (histidine-containing phosphotransfer) domain-containing protein
MLMSASPDPAGGACRSGVPPAAAMRSVAGPAVELDPAELAKLATLDPDGRAGLIPRVLAAFRTSAARLGPQLQAARGQGDQKTIRLVAHTFKSSGWSIGARQLAETGAALESLVQADIAAERPSRHDAEIDALIAALDATLLAVDAWLTKARP